MKLVSKKVSHGSRVVDQIVGIERVVPSIKKHWRGHYGCIAPHGALSPDEIPAKERI